VARVGLHPSQLLRELAQAGYEELTEDTTAPAAAAATTTAPLLVRTEGN
jgi:hypothetical protein